MAVDASVLEAVKRYMRIEDDSDNAVITALCEAAAGYLNGAGITRTDANAARYDLALWSLTLYYYDHRDDVDGASAPFPVGLRPILTQLKYTEATST